MGKHHNLTPGPFHHTPAPGRADVQVEHDAARQPQLTMHAQALRTERGGARSRRASSAVGGNSLTRAAASSSASGIVNEPNRDGSGRFYQMQWFEKACLEWHSENHYASDQEGWVAP